ncbi:phytanoyl-CoA dioxygenase family protein [Cryptococcus neoformans Tu401-1]|nr:phytanoyl-CoA dioxygenase family protein [Cryptococcus neoformans var. grubii Tu401-1]
MSFISANSAVNRRRWDSQYILMLTSAIQIFPMLTFPSEVWLGTHNGTDLSCQEGAHGERASGRIKQDLLDARKPISPPLQPTIPKGSLIIRDLRLWHAGMPNTTDEIRIMLAMIHFAPWYRQRMTMKLPRSPRPILEGVDRLGVAADWQDAEVDHLDAPYGNAFDFSQDQ